MCSVQQFCNLQEYRPPDASQTKNNVYTNLPWVGVELRFMGPQAGMLPIEPPLLVT